MDLTLHAGEVHALIGENGAGKSTLIKLLTGVYRPDAGDIVFQGRPVSFATPLEAQKAGISTIYQEVNLIPLLSVARNLFLGREPRNRFGLLDFARMNREAEETLRGYGVRVDVRRPLRSLGVGAQQMVALARAVASEARIVIMDEPTSSLEPREVETLFSVIRPAARRGHRRRLRQPPPRRAVRRVRHGDRAARRPPRPPRQARRPGPAVPGVHDAGPGAGRGAVGGADEVHRRPPRHRQPARAGGHGPDGPHQLHGVSVSIRPGEVVGLGGLLGSGRTETAKAISGALPTSSGRVTVAGVPLRGVPRRPPSGPV